MGLQLSFYTIRICSDPYIPYMGKTTNTLANDTFKSAHVVESPLRTLQPHIRHFRSKKIFSEFRLPAHKVGDDIIALSGAIHRVHEKIVNYIWIMSVKAVNGIFDSALSYVCDTGIARTTSLVVNTFFFRSLYWIHPVVMQIFRFISDQSIALCYNLIRVAEF